MGEGEGGRQEMDCVGSGFGIPPRTFCWVRKESAASPVFSETAMRPENTVSTLVSHMHSPFFCTQVTPRPGEADALLSRLLDGGKSEAGFGFLWLHGTT